MAEPHDPLEGLPPDKLQAVLQSLEAYKKRRLEALIPPDSVPIFIAGCCQAEAHARYEEAEAKGTLKGRKVFCIITGVPRPDRHGGRGGPCSKAETAAERAKTDLPETPTEPPKRCDEPSPEVAHEPVIAREPALPITQHGPKTYFRVVLAPPKNVGGCCTWLRKATGLEIKYGIDSVQR